MSRSYKKHPWVTDHHARTTKEKKKFANKKVRHHKNLPNGSAYKKVFESWEICDYKWYYSWEDAKKDWEEDKNYYMRHGYPNLKTYYRHWLVCNKIK